MCALLCRQLAAANKSFYGNRARCVRIDRLRAAGASNTLPTFTALTGIYLKLIQTIKVTTFTRNRVTSNR